MRIQEFIDLMLEVADNGRELTFIVQLGDSDRNLEPDDITLGGWKDGQPMCVVRLK